jgi:hypothetical protein
LQRPLAVAVIGGLALSTVITLLLLPVGLDAIGALRREEEDAPIKKLVRYDVPTLNRRPA